MQVDLAGKVIIVTGAGGPIGGATARMAAEAGAEGLLLCDSDGPAVARVADQIGRKTRLALHIADPANRESPTRITYAASSTFGRIDGLVNAWTRPAADSAASMGTGRVTAEDWEQIMAVNARAPFFLMQEVITDMRRRNRRGSIINLVHPPPAGDSLALTITAASFAALELLIRELVRTHEADGIRISGIEAQQHQDTTAQADHEQEVARQIIQLL